MTEPVDTPPPAPSDPSPATWNPLSDRLPAFAPEPVRPGAVEPEPILPATVHAPHAHPLPPPPAERAQGRPLLERLGMAAVALVITVFFGVVGAISFSGGELLLGTMAILGALMTAWVGLLTLVRG
jgi:hypothetical protein